MKFKVEPIVRVPSPSHLFPISSFFLLPPFLSLSLSIALFLSRALVLLLFFSFTMFLLHYFSFTRFLLHYFSFTSSFFRGLSLLLRLLNEAKLDKEGIKDLVKANARKYHTKLTIECENSTPQR